MTKGSWSYWRSCLQEIPKSRGRMCCSVDSSLAKGPPGNSGREGEIREMQCWVREGRKGSFLSKKLRRCHIIFRGRESEVPEPVILSSHRVSDQSTLLGGKPKSTYMVSSQGGDLLAVDQSAEMTMSELDEWPGGVPGQGHPRRHWTP